MTLTFEEHDAGRKSSASSAQAQLPSVNMKTPTPDQGPLTSNPEVHLGLRGFRAVDGWRTVIRLALRRKPR